MRNEKRVKRHTGRFLVVCLTILSLLMTICPVGVWAAPAEAGSGTEMTAIREDADLSGKIVHYQSFDDDGHIGIPFEVATLYDTSKGTVKAGYNGTRIIMYIVDTEHSKAANRVGQGEDKEIIQSMLDRGYIVAVIGYYNDARAVSPDLDYSVQNIKLGMLEGNYFTDGTVIPKAAYKDVYTAPAGYNVSLDNIFWEIDKHSASGSLEQIVDVWNTDFRGVHAQKIVKWVITDENGNPVTDGSGKTTRKTTQNGKNGSAPVWYSDAAGTVVDAENGIYTKVDYTKAETIFDCCNPDGTPLDLDLRMSFAYPVNPKEEAPALTLASSSGYITSNYVRDYMSYFNGSMFKGYIQAVYEYLWVPMAHDDSFGYFDGAATGGSVTNDHMNYAVHQYNNALSDSAAMRYLRYTLSDMQAEGETKFSGKIGIIGNSKGSLMTPISRVEYKKPFIEEGKVLTNEDIEALDAHYSTIASIRQYEDKDGRSRYQYGETAETTNDHGYVIDGGEIQPWLTYPEGSAKAGQEILSSVEAVYSSCGATTTHVTAGASPMFIGSNYYDDQNNQWTSAPTLRNLSRILDIPSMFFEVDLGHRYVTGNDKNHNVDTYQAIFDFYGHYLKDEAVKVMYTEPAAGYERVSLKTPLTVKFSGPVAQEEIEKVTLRNGSNEVEGVWESSFGNTEWSFTPYGEKWTGNTTYTLTIPEGFKGKNGTETEEEYTFTYITEYDNVAEAEVSSNNFTVTVPGYTDTENRAYVRFLVSNDAANIADLYDGDTLVGSVNLRGSGYYEIDVTNYLSGKTAGSRVTFTIVPQKTAGETVIASNAAEQDISPTLTKSKEAEPNTRYYSKKRMIHFGYTTGALREADYGRKFRMSVDIYDNTSRVITLSVPAATSQEKEIIDYHQPVANFYTTKGQWKTYELDYACYEKEYGALSYRTPWFDVAIDSAGVDGPQILAKNIKITEIVTDIEVSDASLSVRKDGSAYAYKAPENAKAFALVSQSGNATYYADFNSAMSAYKAGDTLKLMSNYAFTDADVFDGYTQGVTDTYVIDLSGYRIDLNNTTGGLITAGLSSSGNDSVNITLKNGSAFVGATPVVSYSGDAGATTNYNVNIENVHIGALPYASAKGIVNSPIGVASASGSSINIALKNSDIAVDAASIPASYAYVFAKTDTNMPISITMDGGSVDLTSYRWLTLSNSIQAVKFVKNGGEYPVLTMPASVAYMDAVNVFTNNGTNDTVGSFVKTSTDDGEASYNIEISALATPYGVIPAQYADEEAYPFVMFDINGNFLGATNVFARKTNEAGCVLGMVAANKSTPQTFTYLRRDYTDSTGERYDNLSLMDGLTANIDLGGHTFTWNGANSLFYAIAKRNTSLQFNVLNGTMTTSKAPFIENAGWKSSNYDTSKGLHYFGFSFKNITFKLDAGSTLTTPICKYTTPVTPTADYKTDIEYIDCTFDMTNVTSPVNIINLNNQTGVGQVYHKLQGGKIIANNLSMVKIAAEAEGNTTLSFAKTGGDYTKLYLKSGATAPGDSDALQMDEIKMSYEGAGTDTIGSVSYDVYKIKIETYISGYGAFPEEYMDKGAYPFFIFYENTDGSYEFKTAVSKWGYDNDTTTALGYCQSTSGTSGKKVIYLRRDFEETTRMNFSNLVFANGQIVVDFGGNTITNSKDNALVMLDQKAQNTTKTIQFKNGTVVAKKSGLISVTGGMTSSRPAGGRVMNVIFEDITFKYGANYIGDGGIIYSTKATTDASNGPTAYTTNVTYTECTFDTTALTKNFKVINAGYDAYANTNIVVNGGKVVANSLSGIALDYKHQETGVTNSVVYNPSGEEYINLLLKDASGFSGYNINTSSGSKELVSLSKTEGYEGVSYSVYGVNLNPYIEGYGNYPIEYEDTNAYPFFVFYEQKDGTYQFMTAVNKWGKDNDTTTALGYCQYNGGPGLKKVIYLRRDFEVTSAEFSNLVHTTGQIVIDLGGNVITHNTTTPLVRLDHKKAVTKTIQFKNGTIISNKVSMFVINGGYSESNPEGTRIMNVTFDDVTIKYGANYQGGGGLDYATKSSPTEYTTNLTYNNCTFDTTALNKTFTIHNAGFDDYANVNITLNGCKAVANTASNFTLESKHTSSSAASTITHMTPATKLMLADLTGFGSIGISTNTGAQNIFPTGQTEQYGAVSYFVCAATDKNSVRINEEVAGNKYTCDMYFDNTFTPGSAVAIIAFYGNDGEMKGIGTADVAIANGVVNVEIPVNTPQYDYYRVYLWGDMINCAPLTETE